MYVLVEQVVNVARINRHKYDVQAIDPAAGKPFVSVLLVFCGVFVFFVFFSNTIISNADITINNNVLSVLLNK